MTMSKGCGICSLFGADYFKVVKTVHRKLEQMLNGELGLAASVTQWGHCHFAEQIALQTVGEGEQR